MLLTIVPNIGDTLVAEPPAVSVRPEVKVTLDQVNNVEDGTVPFTSSTGAVVNGTFVQTVVE